MRGDGASLTEVARRGWEERAEDWEGSGCGDGSLRGRLVEEGPSSCTGDGRISTGASRMDGWEWERDWMAETTSESDLALLRDCWIGGEEGAPGELTD